MAQSARTVSSNTLVPDQSTTTLDSATKNSKCADPAHQKLPRHIHLSMPCFGHKPATDPHSTEPHAKPHAKPHKDICPPGTGGEVLGNGDMSVFGGYGISDAGNGIGMLGPYPKGYDANKPSNGLPPTPLQEWEKMVEEAEEKAFGGRKLTWH